jgi:hypothetical protein
MLVDQFIGLDNAIVVAHPDDEILWAGGLPLHFRDRRWTIICCSIPIRDPIRAYKFFDVCEALGARGRILPYVHPERAFPLENMDQLDLSPYDTIITHNEVGEYGHFQHKWVNAFVREHYTSNSKRILTFGYSKDRVGELSLTLNEWETELKIKAMRKYDYPVPGNSELVQWQFMEAAYIAKWGLNMSVETYDLLHISNN